MSFLAPWMLFALVLASAPIIIHLLNRRRFLRVDWAPMKYLKLTLKSNRRRLRLEQWLLLAVRTLAVLALFLAVARPVGTGTNLAGFLHVQGRASRVIVIDDSLSMSAQTDGQAAFARALETAVQILQVVGQQDSITVIRTSQPDEPLVRHAQPDEEQSARLYEAIRTMEQRQSASNWTTTLEAVDSHLQSAVYPLREVLLVTDLWVGGWNSDSIRLCDRWEEQKVTLRIFDVGKDPTGNRSVVSLEQATPVALLDTVVTVTATIRNDGAEPLKSEQALLKVDESVQPVVLPEIATDSTVEVPLSLTFDQPGQHRVTLQLPADVLPDDDVRHLIVDVRRNVDVTLVDGDPGLAPFESETDFLEIALTAGNAPWHATRAISSEWLEQPLTAPDIVVLANVTTVPPERVQELEELVSAGMGLMIFAGNEVDVDGCNGTLYRDGKGLLPARISQVRDDEVAGLTLEPFPDSPLAPLGKISPEALSRIRPRRFADVSLSAETDEQVRVLARWNDPQQSPAVLEKQFGRGRVLFWTVSADREWSDWPTDASYVLAMRMAAQAIAARASLGENLLCGQPITFPLNPDLAPTQATMQHVGSETVETLPVDRTIPDAPRLVELRTHAAGFYEARWDEAGLGERTQLFAADPDLLDVQQMRLSTASLPSFFGRLTPKVIQFSGNADDVATQGSELWRYLIVGLLGLTLVESCLASWVGRVR